MKEQTAREDKTEEQQEALKKINAPMLHEFYNRNKETLRKEKRKEKNT